MNDPTLLDHCARVEEHIQRNYRIRVLTIDVPDPLTGDLDGAEIDIDYALDAEQRLFLLGHLFGHTVQWNVNPQAFELGQIHEPPVAENLMPAILEYEREAAAFGLALFHEANVRHLDQWFSDYTTCDMAYLAHFYRTGEKRGFRTFWQDGTPLIEARPIPPFTPRQRVFRHTGIVI